MKSRTQKTLVPGFSLAGAKTAVVAVEDVDFDDETFRVRQDLTKSPFAWDALQISGGVVDFSTGHPVVLQRTGKTHLIVNGFRRLSAVARLEEVKRVKCLVLDGLNDHQSAVVAARINLSHGRHLTVSERKACFHIEMVARAALGTGVSDRSLARAYGVSPSTIGKWRNPPRTSKKPSPSPVSGVQSGRPGAVTESTTPSADDTEPSTVPSSSHEATENTRPQTAAQPNVDRFVAEFDASMQLFKSQVHGLPLTSEHRDVLNRAVRDLSDVIFNSLDHEEVAA